MRITRPLAAVAAATAAAMALVTAVPAVAAEPDPKPVALGSRWLAGQLTKNLVHNQQYQFDDYGLSIDVAFGLDGAGKKPEVVEAITRAIAKNVEAYTTFAPSNIYAGATAKALVLAVQQGKDPRSFGGTDLVAQLEGLVASAAPITGRIQDAYEPTTGGDFANVIGQAYAAAGLSAVHSPKAASATAFLLQQQCAKGFFRLGFTIDKTDADQSCTGAAKSERAPDTDATAIAVLALLEVKGLKAKTAVENAVAWLVDQQAAKGSFGGGSSTEDANTNSSGLAGWALGEAGAAKPAARAAAWVRGLQVPGANPCSGELDGDAGAIAYDDTAYGNAQGVGIKKQTSDQWRRASAQALPVLRWAPRGQGDFTASGPRTVRVGQTLRIHLTGVARGERVCVSIPGSTYEFLPGKKATTEVSFVVPKGGSLRTYAVWLGNKRREVTVRVTG